MKPPLGAFVLVVISLLALCLLAGCSTKADRNGFTTYVNFKRMEYRNDGRGAFSFVGEGVNHSTPTRAAGSVVGTAGSAIVSGITAAAAL